MAAEIPPEVSLSSGRKIPQLGFGWDRPDDDESEEAIGLALETGYRLVDTGAYYRNEVGVGRALAGSGVPREELFVSTKVWNGDHGHATAVAACKASIERLGLDYVDLYLMHWPCPGRDLYVDTWRGFEELAAEGLAKSIGVANFDPAHIDRLLAECETAPVINQVELHPEFQQRDLVSYHRVHGIVTEAWRPLALGRILEDPRVTSIAEAKQRTPGQIVIRWHLQVGNVLVPKTGTPERIRANFDVFDFELSAEEMAAMAVIDSPEGRMGPLSDFEAITDAEVEAIIADVDPKRPKLA